ncbi:Thaumatin, pathogenesis-related protein [Metarhizium rileyi]|uniref:Thaumatin, pathogenesis-related protein n=1 Tax=Metarhizium rileyi (strain RCEF 4871) TaxID=1649241 RepID=A0A167DR35_METRR|nr:Thaumatin, pathogenesis-related protein [Metarhizium rileyi RCEF 4871]
MSGLALSSAAPLAAAPSPASTPEPIEVSIRRELQLGTAIGGALDLPPEATAGRPTADVVAAVSRMTVTVVNRNGGDVSTIHVNARGGPKPISGNTKPGRMENGAQSMFVVGGGWSGNIAVNNARYSDTTGDESLIEASFVKQFGKVQGDINISYVNGFSTALVCWCNQNKITVGCNKDLSALHKCPNPNGQGSCKNPHRAGPDTATEFFKPCHGYAGPYVYPNDNKANQLNAKCPKKQYTCCIGKACPANPARRHW